MSLRLEVMPGRTWQQRAQIFEHATSSEMLSFHLECLPPTLKASLISDILNQFQGLKP